MSPSSPSPIATPRFPYLKAAADVAPAHLALAFFVTLAWGINFVAAKVAVDYFPPFATLAVRFVLLALILSPFLRTPRAMIGPMIVIGLLIGAIHLAMQYFGLALAGDVS
ncbi:MAG: hypothetical protein EXQ85_08140, partial [Alphaproteobacteria bacterium]|nr:hypothetical protein [Alphaproteobacteria bacterium]